MSLWMGSLKTIVYYVDYRKIPGLSEDPTANHVFKAHFLKDFSTVEKAIAVQKNSDFLSVVQRDENGL